MTSTLEEVTAQTVSVADEVVSVIVTTRNSATTLEACLRSVRAQTYPAVELIVVDNHSEDATPEVARRYADVVEVAGPERSAQRNLGASLARGELLLFLDADMVLDQDVVADAMASLRGASAPASIITEVTVGEGFWTRCRILERSCYAGDDQVEAARLYRREAFERAGGFDEALTGGEDWDLSRRVAQGARLPRTRAIIRHDEGHIRLREAYSRRRYYAPGYLLYLRKHGGAAAMQGNPILRSAYLRNWRALMRHPVLTAGMLSLKAVEAAAVVHVLAEQRIGGRRSARPMREPRR